MSRTKLSPLEDSQARTTTSSTSPQKRSSNQALLAALGSGQSMPEPVQAKMEQSMGADFSGVKLYESDMVSQGGANAAASGNRIAFAPGKLDFSSRSRG